MDPSEIEKPYVNEDLARELVKKLYGLQVISIEKMVSYDDKNFHVKVSPNHRNAYIKEISNDGYTLKITNPGKSSSPGHFDSMHAVIRHLRKKEMHVPWPVQNLEGKLWCMENIPVVIPLRRSKESKYVTKSKCGVQLLTFLPGIPLGSLQYTTDILFRWGYLLAEFHNALEDFSNKALDNKVVFWDLRHVPMIENFMGDLDSEKTDLVIKILTEFPVQVGTIMSLLPKGYIHGDFNENNILAREKTIEGNPDTVEYVVEGILDLDDMHYGTYVWDVGVMLAYTSLECSTIDPLEGMGHALAGYLKLRKIYYNELRTLKMCIVSRLCQSLVYGAYSYRRDPKNSYLLLSSKTGWSRLQLIWETPNDNLLRMWEDIRDSYKTKSDI